MKEDMSVREMKEEIVRIEYEKLKSREEQIILSNEYSGLVTCIVYFFLLMLFLHFYHPFIKNGKRT